MTNQNPQQLTISEHERALAPRNMLEAVMAEVRNPATDPARLREFLEIGRQLQADQAKAEFNRAFSALKRVLPAIPRSGIVRDKSGRQLYKYARFEDLHRTLTPLLTEHGFATSFEFRDSGSNRIICVLRLTHEGGHAETFEAPMPAAGQNQYISNLQNAASAQSFAKRRLLIDVFDILTEGVDDDGSGLGVPEKISQDEVSQMGDILHEIGPEKSAAFMRWLATQGVQRIEDIDQGQAHKMALSMLLAKRGGPR